MVSTATPIEQQPRYLRKNERYQPEELGPIFVDLYARINRVCSAIVRNDGLAEEFTQETFFRAWLHIKDFRGKSSLLTWLTSIAANLSFMYLRAQKRGEAKCMSFEDSPLNLFDVIPDPLSLNPEEVCLENEFWRVHIKAIKGLPNKLREVFMLRHLDGFSISEAAQRLQLTQPALKSRDRRAAAQLEDVLRRRGYH